MRFRLPPRQRLAQYFSILEQATSEEEEEALRAEWEKYVQRLQEAPRGGKGCTLPPFLQQNE